MTFDTTNGYVVLFGGYSVDSGWLNDTWKFVHGVWTELTPVPAPSPRAFPALTYDAKDGYVLLFGGTDDGAYLGDTWKFVSGTWTQLTSSKSPSARYGASMTYDPADGYVVLFGGYGSSGVLSDTWTFLAGAWTKLAPKVHPSARDLSSMTYDANSSDRYVVLFGGGNKTGSVLGDTWKFRGGVWTKLAPTKHPSARFLSSLTYDANDGFVLLFGGNPNGGSGILNDSWKFVGGQWTKLAPKVKPPARDSCELAYDTADKVVVLFGGIGSSGDLGDTWEFAHGAWADVT